MHIWLHEKLTLLDRLISKVVTLVNIQLKSKPKGHLMVNEHIIKNPKFKLE